MRIHMLGGGNEVGASMSLVEVGQTRLVVDCGIRMGSSGSALPDLAGIGDKPVDAIVLTHAHLDHCGAMPLLHSAMTKVPIYCTPATKELVRVMLGDALRVMDQKLAQEQELPLYPPEAVQSMLSAMITVPFGATVRVGPQEETSIRFMPAGHIMGAAMVALWCRSEKILFTGDVSLDEQMTVLGMVPPAESFNCVVTESTYGGRLHSDRQTEVNRFLAKAQEVVGRGGKMLVPAFALGRSQELLLILIHAMQKSGLPPVPVWADGLVREVCGSYNRYSGELPRFARKLSEKHGNPFFGPSPYVQPVTGGTAQRDEILSGPPCIIVSSSGMLTGGPSQYFARKLALDEANCISLTGYQDEESPGRRLQEMAQGQSRTLMVQGGSVEVACEITTYGLSAHADGNQLLQLIRRTAPEHVVLVHGDQEARMWLAQRVEGASVHVPVNGEVLDLRPGAARRIGPPPKPLSNGRPLTVEALAEVAAVLRRERLENRPIPMSLILDRWFGPGNWGEQELTHLPLLLDQALDFKNPELRRPDLWLVLPDSVASQLKQQALGPWPQARVSARVEQLLPPGSGLRRAALYFDKNHCVLHFDLPRVAARQFTELMQKLEEETKWTFAMDHNPNQAEVLRRVTVIVQEVTTVVKAGLDLGQGAVKCKVDPMPPEDQIQPLEEAVMEQTGYKLFLDHKPGAASTVGRTLSRHGPMEINACYAIIKESLSGTITPVLKASLKSDHVGSFVEVRFITPEAGQRLASQLEELSDQIGRRIQVGTSYAPQELQQAAISCLPADAPCAGLPSVLPHIKSVKVVIAATLDQSIIEKAQERFRELTAWSLVVG